MLCLFLQRNPEVPLTEFLCWKGQCQEHAARKHHHNEEHIERRHGSSLRAFRLSSGCGHGHHLQDGHLNPFVIQETMRAVMVLLNENTR